MMNMQLNADTYTSWKKELIKYLKDFDKLYVKHIKSGYVEMNAIHTSAMKPLVEIMSSNYNLNNLELLEKKNPDLPSFRRHALQDKFIQHMTRLCEIFRDFGTLKDLFNIKQMLSLLDTPNWKNETPLAFYLTPLQDSLKDVRECLLKMHSEGPLHCKYIVENNEELMKKVCEMVKKDVIAQWLAGDELKQDQFKFIYQTMRIMYMSALKPLLLAEDKRVIETILPNLVAYRAIRQGKDIMIRKKNDAKREQERVERMARTGGSMLSMQGTQSALGST